MSVEPRVVVELHELTPQASAAVVRLNRPTQLNAIDADMLAELDAAFDAVAADPSIRAVMVTGTGRAFSAGGDMQRYIELQADPIEFPRFVAEFHRVTGRLRAMSKPVVALVNGVTVAGGLELVLNCDVTLIANSARIGDAHLNFGQMGGGGVLTLLPRAIGRAKAAELIFSGRLLSATEAVEWGLASRAVADADLLPAGLELAVEIAAKSSLAVANAKEVMTSVWASSLSVENGLEYELARNSYYCLTSHDAPEGLRAFADRRAPRFEGR